MKYLYWFAVMVVLVLGAWTLFGSNAEPQFTGSGDAHPLENNEEAMNQFSLTSSAFPHNGSIPSKYTCDGENISPPLSIASVPEGTQTLVLIMDDPDIPQVFKDQRGIDSFDHWAMYAIDPKTTDIPEGTPIGALGLNGSGKEGYTGPCPPSEYEPTMHRYIFTLYAISGSLNFIQTPTKAEILSAIGEMIIGKTELIGTYDRSGK